jgi:electron transport complex protein RnfB
MLTAIAVLTLLATALAAMLQAAAHHFRADDSALVTAIEQRLPKIQCGQCGYPGCRPYAEAIAAERTTINRCPPGGEETVAALAQLLGQEALPLDRTLGSASMTRVARIDEATCIGCNLCARACPVDAIVGVPQTMHTVIASVCTGCELCLAPCPVDCIDLVTRHG